MTPSELTSTAYGVVIASLRDDDDAITTLLDGLTAEQMAVVTRGAVTGLAQALLYACTPDYIEHIIATVQGYALTETGEAA
ncbi:hypothetical protein ACWV2X_08520 [Streptomyces hydrogenans]